MKFEQWRFWSNATRADNGCLEWAGAVDKDGYGVASKDGRRKRAHRLAWELTRGAIPPGALVCHACDNPRCMNPDHLFVGTTADNVNDRVTKGRTAWGEGAGSKLSEDCVRAILSALLSGETHRAIAARYGVSKATVTHIRSGRNWSRLWSARRPESIAGRAAKQARRA